MHELPFILILGMHRSGTSCLAGCLQACGLCLGHVSRRGRFNAKGNRESEDVWKVQDQILGLNKGTWHKPPDSIVVHPVHQLQLRNIVDRLSAENQTAGLKDPRTLLILPVWRQLIGERCRLAGTFRHPLAVAESLAKRDNLSRQRSLALWIRYNGELVRQHQSESFPLIEYNLTDPDLYRHRCARVARQLGLSPNLSQMRRFVSRDLDHHRPAPADVPACCRELYDYLRSHAVNGVDSNSAERRAPTRLRSSAVIMKTLFVQSSQMPPNADF